MNYRPYIVDCTIPGMAEVEVQRLIGQRERNGRGISRRLLRDLGLDRDAS